MFHTQSAIRSKIYRISKSSIFRSCKCVLFSLYNVTYQSQKKVVGKQAAIFISLLWRRDRGRLHGLWNIGVCFVISAHRKYCDGKNALQGLLAEILHCMHFLLKWHNNSIQYVLKQGMIDAVTYGIAWTVHKPKRYWQALFE